MAGSLSRSLEDPAPPPLAWGGDSPRMRPGSLPGGGLLSRLSELATSHHASLAAATSGEAAADLETPLLPVGGDRLAGARLDGILQFEY